MLEIPCLQVTIPVHPKNTEQSLGQGSVQASHHHPLLYRSCFDHGSIVMLKQERAFPKLQPQNWKHTIINVCYNIKSYFKFILRGLAQTMTRNPRLKVLKCCGIVVPGAPSSPFLCWYAPLLPPMFHASTVNYQQWLAQRKTFHSSKHKYVDRGIYIILAIWC